MSVRAVEGGAGLKKGDGQTNVDGRGGGGEEGRKTREHNSGIKNSTFAKSRKEKG